MKVAAGQFAAGEEWRDNAAACTRLIEGAASDGTDLLVLPEGVLTRFTADFGRVRHAAQPLDGPFMDAVTTSTRGSNTTVVLGIHERSGDDVFNTLAVLRNGALVSTYRKLHLYDAFGACESDNVTPGQQVPDLISCAGFQVGLMTCYDLRFPELARLHADRGADVLAVPAAWVRGPHKERHWELVASARALDNTCYVVATGECGPRNIGSSMIVDPMGVVICQRDDRPGVASTIIERSRLDDVRQRLPVLGNRRFMVDPAPRAIKPGPAGRVQADNGPVSHRAT